MTTPAPAKAPASPTATLVSFVIVIVVAILVFRSCTDTEPKPTGPTTTDAASMCKEFVKDRLKSPSSADFQNIYQADVTQNNPTTFTVKSYVDSQNSFGAMMRTNYVCKIKYSGNDQWNLLDLTTDP